ncbi:hypothetical protein J3458_000326 [Metarhizium acridum]|uniref:uncharacterized protein n=1 Tax=Metarhizium acridum TaxID=92637 RepID=UPI001C6C81A2|nr:hypothetical protein J3458_000326 [Metarhizium acridum]
MPLGTSDTEMTIVLHLGVSVFILQKKKKQNAFMHVMRYVVGGVGYASHCKAKVCPKQNIWSSMNRRLMMGRREAPNRHGKVMVNDVGNATYISWSPSRTC